MPLWNFVQCVVYKDLAALGSHDNPEAIWEAIFNEYIDLTKSTKSSQLLRLYCEISQLEGKHTILLTILAQLAIKRTEGLIELLQKDMGYRYSYSEATFDADIKRTLTQSKNDILQLQLKRGELEKLSKAPQKELTEADFDDDLAEISKYQGIHYKMKDITVTEYVTLINKMNEHYEKLSQQNSRKN